MSNNYFVDKGSIVRQIWGNGDTILFIFAGASAEFALNKAVDWLYFTGKLPSDPLGRLFSTVSYARGIVFSEERSALKTIDQIAAIHSAVESRRSDRIPDWAYRDVLFMLIDYSIKAFELLERDLNYDEKQEVFRVFQRVGDRMKLQDLPRNYESWKDMRQIHLERDLKYSRYTKDLYLQYSRHLGPIRYRLLLEAQKLVVPDRVQEQLSFQRTSLLVPVLNLYKFTRRIKLDWFLKKLILPSKYKKEIQSLDQ